MSLLFIVLSAKVERDHRGHHDHHIVRGDLPTHGKHRKNCDDHHGDDGLHLDQRRQIFQNIHFATS